MLPKVSHTAHKTDRDLDDVTTKTHTKYRKAHKGRIHGMAKGGTRLSYGAFGLKAMEPERITARQIEAARRAISRAMKRQGRLWILIFPDIPVSKKPAEVRMGSGKGTSGILGCPRSFWAGSCLRLDGVA